MRVTVTGGAGYIGATAARELLSAGHEVTVLDSLLHGQEDVAAALEAAGARVVRGDVRDAAARRAALDGAEAVVHLAAIVGDPACAKDPELSQAVNVEGTRALVRGRRRGAHRVRLDVLELRPHGRPARARRRDRPARAGLALRRAEGGDRARAAARCPTATCLRFATIYGVAERMRFDLTVNEFTRDLWDGRTLDVYGEQFWRPYVHVGRRGARAGARARGAGGARRPAASSTSATATRTTASSTSSS